MFQTHFILGAEGTSQRAMRGKTNKPFSILQAHTRKHKKLIFDSTEPKEGKTATWGADSL